MDVAAEKRLIAKNTFIVYIRLFFATIIGLLTSRYVLKILGASDFGLYNVVGGIIALFSFVSGSLSATTIRFLNVEIGKKNGDPNKIFNICNVIHIGFALLLLFFAETIGLFYINNYLNVEVGKELDAMFVFQVSTLVACLGLVNVPYMSTFVAKERFLLIALVDISSSIIKLVAVVCLFRYNGNVLRAYALLMSLSTVFSYIVYYYLSHKKWPLMVRWNFVKDKQSYKQVLVFNNYNILATVSSIIRSQGSNILINFFFGTIVNGAYGIAKTVQGFVASFMSNFDSAAAPKINQNVGGGNNGIAENIVYSISRYCILMMIIVFFPLYAEIEFVLHIWLGDFPDYTVIFCQSLLIVLMISSTGAGILQYINASGKIKWFKIVSCLCSLIVLPVGYYLFKKGFEPWWIFILLIITDIINRVCQLVFMRTILNFDSLDFIKRAWLKPLYVTVLMCVYLVLYKCVVIPNDLIRCLGIIITLLFTGILVWYIGLYREERKKILGLVMDYFNKQRNA